MFVGGPVPHREVDDGEHEGVGGGQPGDGEGRIAVPEGD